MLLLLRFQNSESRSLGDLDCLGHCLYLLGLPEVELLDSLLGINDRVRNLKYLDLLLVLSQRLVATMSLKVVTLQVDLSIILKVLNVGLICRDAIIILDNDS